jgi:phosphatidate phosphatase APP1
VSLKEKNDWQRQVAPVVRAVEKRYDALKYRLYYLLGGPGPIKIFPYRGYGTRHKMYLQGRVLEERGITPPSDTDSWWDNLVNMIKRIRSREVPHARLTARFQDATYEVAADEEGMFELWIDPSRPVANDRMWQSVELELIEPKSDRQEGPVRATGQVLVPPPSARFGVISDVDDTVIQSDVSSLLQMLGTVLFSNARTRPPLPGVAALYRALHAGPHGQAKNPMFYVSNGLWNLYDLLEDFFQLNQIPGGPVLLLRNWGVYRDEILPTQQREHKLGIIGQILDLYTDLRFILIGDSSEADPEIYHEIVHRYPDRILAVYVRDVSRDLARPAAIRALADEIIDAGSTLLLADDSLTMAQHAVKRGWISSEALSDIHAEQMLHEASSNTPPNTKRSDDEDLVTVDGSRKDDPLMHL